MMFVFPNNEYEQQTIEFIKEFHDYKSEINGTGGLDGYLETSTYQDWLMKVQCDRDCGGILDDEFYSQTFDEVVQRYIIKNHESIWF